MKNKIIKIALLLAAFVIGSLQLMTVSANAYSDPKYVKGELNFLVNGPVKPNTPAVTHWRAFRFEYDPRGGYARLLPVIYDEKYYMEDDYRSGITFVSDFTFKALDKNNVLLGSLKVSSGTRIEALQDWLFDTPSFKLGDYGLQISTTSTNKVFRFNGEIGNYKDLVLKDAPQTFVQQYAFVPSPKDSKEMYARFIDQDTMDTSKPYIIKPKAAPYKFVSFDDQNNIVLFSREQKWKLVYDQKRFAYKISPISDTWGGYGMFWQNPTKVDVTLSPQPIDIPSETLGEFWHFKKTDLGEYLITPMRQSKGAGYKLNVNNDNTNISASLNNNINNQIFYLAQPSN